MGGLAKWRFGGFAAVARSSDLFDAVTHGSDGTQTQLEAQRLERWRRDEDSSLYFVLRQRWLKFAMRQLPAPVLQPRQNSDPTTPPTEDSCHAAKFSKRVFSAEPRPKIAPFVRLTREGSKRGASANSS